MNYVELHPNLSCEVILHLDKIASIENLTPVDNYPTRRMIIRFIGNNATQVIDYKSDKELQRDMGKIKSAMLAEPNQRKVVTK